MLFDLLHILVFEEDKYVSVHFVSIQIRDDIRKPWDRCVFTNWDAVMYSNAFHLMKMLVKNLNLDFNEENQIIAVLQEWKINGKV